MVVYIINEEKKMMSFKKEGISGHISMIYHLL
jgi:hypothetical protein